MKVWYAAYGSNMHLSRLGTYLRGGRPSGGARVYPGCRDPRPPAESAPVMLPGQMYFALESPAWTGGLGLYDPYAGGETAARAHLLTAGQFSDVAAQEMYREPGADLDLGEALANGTSKLGEGRYETLVHTGTLDGLPVLTFTAGWAMGDVEWRPPSANYLRHLAVGLVEAHGWAVDRVAEYLAGRPGAAGTWSPERIADLMRTPAST